jgi:hypothetical protein
MPKGYLETVNQRWKDNAMNKREKNKRTNNDLQNITQEIKIEQYKPQYKSVLIISSCSTSDTRRITVK